VAAAVLHAQQLCRALVELVVADRADVDAHRVEGLDGGLVVEEPRDQRAGADVVAGADDERVAVLRAQRVDVRGEVLGPAGRGAHAAR